MKDKAKQGKKDETVNNKEKGRNIEKKNKDKRRNRSS